MVGRCHDPPASLSYPTTTIDRNPAGGWNVHRLLQRGHSVVYFDGEEETEDRVPAAEIDDPIGLSIHEPPAWKLWVANWPTCDEKPMGFVGQVNPPENDVTRELLNWLCTIYLFCSTSDAGTRYKIVDQDRGAQTAEEHYWKNSFLATLKRFKPAAPGGTPSDACNRFFL
jgi:hypothetical protein